VKERGLIKIWASVNLLFAAILPLGAYAGFVDFKCQTNCIWNFDSTSSELNLNLNVVGSDEVLMYGATDSDPTFHVTETVTNNSGLSWTAYELILSESGASFDYSNAPTSSRFQNFNEDSTTSFTFYSPNEVPNGTNVTFDFDISVPLSGLFSFTLTQQPIPEPATIALLGLCALSLLRRKRGM
jgi:hypothetical protein